MHFLHAIISDGLRFRRRVADTDREMITLLSKSKGGNSATFAANFPTFPDLVAFPNGARHGLILPSVTRNRARLTRPAEPLLSHFDITLGYHDNTCRAAKLAKAPITSTRWPVGWLSSQSYVGCIDKLLMEYKPVLQKSRREGLRFAFSRCSAGSIC